MKGPITYSDWIEIFERFGNGDDNVFEEMDSGAFELDSGTARRFYVKAEEAHRKRKQNWLKNFQRSFHTGNIKSADDFEMILLAGKKNLTPLVKFSISKGLPEDLKSIFNKDLTEFIEEIKKSLRENISKTDSNREEMTLIVSSFNLPEITEESLFTINTRNPENSSTIIRKIIF